MDDSLYYLVVNRQSGLASELDTIANNIANLDTTGFRREGVAFTEFIIAADRSDSVSMADLGARFASELPGTHAVTGGRFDFAIQGEGYFVLETPDGPVLTRAGAFQASQDGFLVTPNGDPVLDGGQGRIVIPADAKDILVAADGTISVNGDPIGQLAIVNAPQELISRYGDTAFKVEDNAFQPVATPNIRQGALEQSNVDPVLEFARMIEVTRAYELAQTLIDDEDERIQNIVRTLGQPV
ncbi:MAG: flagellar hook-basal body complex protein [Pseudomonadota bacterium]